MSNEGGIVCGGTICIDYVVLVDQWPLENSLSNIHEETKTGGGGPFNVLKDLRSMDENLSLAIVGLLGDDDNGRWLINDCQKSNIDTNQLHITKDKTPTSYTYVISVESTGRRTFFNQRGTNALLTNIHFDLNYLVKEKNYNLFYIGYVTILNQLDRIIDNETITGKILKQAKEYGLETIVDFVSTPNILYSKLAELTLPYVDHLVLNEIEAEYIVNQTLKNGTIHDVEKIAKILIEQYHVQRTVTIHFDRGAVCASRENGRDIECFRQGSLRLPDGFIKSAVGAGDAFAAGIIYGIYKKWSIQERLTCAVCVAAICLTDETPHGGVKTIEECMKLKEMFPYRILDDTSLVYDIQQ
jgi:sugar/nucleoside kinase (ribokinase family)